MRLYTNLAEREIYAALDAAKANGKVTHDVLFMVDFARRNAQSPKHRYSYEIQLGTYDQNSLPAGYLDQYGHKMNVRRFKNTGDRGASSYERIWAATWHEWGWFIAEIFKLDQTARFGWYKDMADFNSKTNEQFDTTPQKAFSYTPQHP